MNISNNQIYHELMKILITRTINLEDSILNPIRNIFQNQPGPFKIEILPKPIHYSEENFNWSLFFNECEKYRSEIEMEKDDFLVILTELSNQVNYFCASDDDNPKTFFIHAKYWEYYIQSEAWFPVSYLILAMSLRLLYMEKIKNSEPEYHKISIGCLNDFCGNKIDISLKFRTADVCQDCIDKLQSVGMQEHLQQSINVFESIRKEMLYNKNYHNRFTFEESLPFPIAITKRKINSTSEILRKALLMIDHFDSIVRTSVFYLLCINFKEETDRSNFLRDSSLKDKPSLGKLFAALKNLVKISSAHGIEEIDENSFKDIIMISNEQEIIKFRNEHRGHGYINCKDDTYLRYFGKLIPELEKIESKLVKFYSQFQLLHITKLDHIGAGNFKITADHLKGSNIQFHSVDIYSSIVSVDKIPETEKIYIYNQATNKWISVHPYIVFDDCPFCNHKRVLIYDGESKLDPFIGHRFP